MNEFLDLTEEQLAAGAKALHEGTQVDAVLSVFGNITVRIVMIPSKTPFEVDFSGLIDSDHANVPGAVMKKSKVRLLRWAHKNIPKLCAEWRKRYAA